MNDNRLQWCEELWDRLLLACPANEETQEGRRHMSSVSAIAGKLARLRGVDEELAWLAGFYHDLAAVETGIRKEHAHTGAARTRELLGKLVTGEMPGPRFTENEMDDLCAAIYFHTDKDKIHFPLAEVLKDADLLDRFLDCPDYNPGRKSTERLVRLRAELGDLQTAARRLSL